MEGPAELQDYSSTQAQLLTKYQRMLDPAFFTSFIQSKYPAFLN
jgi:hypothetical protein